MLLAFACVARSASAGLYDGEREIAFADLCGAPAESGLVPLLDQLIRTHGKPTALAVANGPGSFTGLRIGITAARTLAWLEELPVHGVDALAALAAEHAPRSGEALRWALVPLKKDTTFHGLFRIAGNTVQTVIASSAQPDAQPPELPDLSQALAVGPALKDKPGLAERWSPDIALGTSAELTARGVARVAAGTPAVDWSALLPAYHQQPAPVLQRLQQQTQQLTQQLSQQ